MMKVLHLLWDGHLGGVQRYLLKVITAPFWQDVEHEVCFFDTPGVILSEGELPDIPVRALSIRHGWQLLRARSLRQVVSEINPSVIHCHCDTPAFALQIGAFKDRRLIYTEHGDTIMRRERSWFTELMWRHSGPAWNTAIMNSNFVEADFLRRFPWMEGRTVVMPNPLIECGEDSTAFERPPGPPRIGVFGRLVWQKGMDWFLEAAGLVHDRLPEATFFIHGDGPVRSELEALSAQLGLANYVTFEGFVNDPLFRMGKMDVSIVPSRIEPFGLVALEAQSTGTPVVGFTDSGVAEIVLDGKTGRIVPHGDRNALADAVVDIVENPQTRAAMGRAARQHAIHDFSLEAHVTGLEALYGG
ncbi:MAG: glycosyltransferase family 4 protein [Planctomycetota bacterium]|jgi:glycosyltransferase involved in cell wall biosynthesis